MNNFQIDQGSFRDRHGRIFYLNEEVYRGISKEAFSEWENFSSKPFYASMVSAGKLVKTEKIDDFADLKIPGNWEAVLKHQKIPFISYPYEWSFGMLKDAALLQLELLLRGLKEDIILKDSSAFNVQWVGTNPIFIDIPSFQKLAPGEPWVGYKQFCQMFLYPLMIKAYKDIPFHPFLRGSIDGIDSEHCNNLMSSRDLFRSGVFLYVYLQSKFQKKYSDTKRVAKKELKSAGFNKEMIRANIKRLQNLTAKLQWKKLGSEWGDYAEDNSYPEEDQRIKQNFVRDCVKTKSWKLVWDLGCNTGTFSRIAAENSEYVLAMDLDHLAVEKFYQELKREGNKTILPLVNNLADPSPNLGWRGMERKALPERGKPDLTLCLALIHHMVISANIPMSDFINWLASLGSSLIIEFVTKDDEMVKTLLRNKEDIYTDYELGPFESLLSNHFNIEKRLEVKSGTRILYYASNKGKI
ncbi:methyltransferase [Bdellovibrionota bacterium]